MTVLVFAWIGRYSPSPWLSVFLFFTLQYFALSMNFLRQALAAAIVLWVYPFLKNRRFLPVCGIILLAACFHRTALIMLPLCIALTLPPTRHHYGLALLPAAAQAPCKLVSSKVRTGLLIAGALAYFLFAASQGFHGVYPYHGIWERALTP